jgi:hypothetical protein
VCVFFYINIKKTRLGGGGYPDRWQQPSAALAAVLLRQYTRAFCAARLGPDAARGQQRRSSGGQCRSCRHLVVMPCRHNVVATISLVSFSVRTGNARRFFPGVKPLQSSLTQDDGRRDKKNCLCRCHACRGLDYYWVFLYN